MGNVMASESSPGASAVPTPIPSATSPDSDRNPGTMEDLHKKCKDVFPMYFEGAKFLVNKALSNNFQVSHTLTMSNSMPSGYRFGATYIGSSRVISMQEAYPILFGDVDMSGNLQAHILHAPTDKLRCKMLTQIQQSKWQGCQLSADYKETNYTASLTLANPDLLSGTGVGVLHYLQNVTRNLALGSELVYQASPQLPGGQVAVMSVAGRYSGPDYALSASISNSGSIHTCFYQKCSEDIQIGAELEANAKMQECMATVGYQVDLPRAGFVMRGAVDTNWTVRTVIEKKLTPMPFTLTLCSLINHPKNSFQMGCGLIIG